ncbi:hypothetical protein MANES_17G010201v8 [Manihot esculenta]|uniref:Uncharacterized protein n=1 Tax=Manihot esculenta TaxID=3983 RepID=A0ACB7G5T9_MANES|nr:hypothetical protein MANES_17G010201v8 [Manihot esculenta]
MIWYGSPGCTHSTSLARCKRKSRLYPFYVPGTLVCYDMIFKMSTFNSSEIVVSCKATTISQPSLNTQPASSSTHFRLEPSTPINSSHSLPANINPTGSLPPISNLGRKRKLTSTVWDHFEKSLHNHIEKCVKKGNQDIVKCLNKQKKISMDIRSDGKVHFKNFIFNQEKSRKELACAIMLHEYPLFIVEYVGFTKFVATLQPLFKMVSRNTIKKDILNIYDLEFNKLYKYLEKLKSRIAITTDMWTSNQKKGYMSITTHYINNSGCYKIEFCDNCSTNDGMVSIVIDKLFGNLLCDGVILHMRSCAHILNLVVKDGLTTIETSSQRVEKFEEMVRQLKITCTKKLSLDCKSRWNSTYHMLQTTIEYKNTFSRLRIRKKNEVHIVLVVAVILDPQYKTKVVEYYFPMIYSDDVSNEIEQVNVTCYNLLNDYQSRASKPKSQSSSSVPPISISENQGFLKKYLLISLQDLSNLVIFLNSSFTSIHVKFELDHYLEEPVLLWMQEFDILNWWKINGIKYPTLQMIARDFLVLPVSSVASESAFRTGGRVVSIHRSRLHEDTLEVLICSQNWLWSEIEGNYNNKLLFLFYFILT